MFVIVERFPVVTNLELPTYETLNVVGKQCKTQNSNIAQFVVCLKCEILILDAWNEYIKENDGIVNLFFYRTFNVRMIII